MGRRKNSRGSRGEPNRHARIPPRRRANRPKRLYFSVNYTLLGNFPRTFTFRHGRKRRRSPRRNGRGHHARGRGGGRRVRQLYPSGPGSMLQRDRLESVIMDRRCVYGKSRRNTMGRSKPILKRRSITSVPRQPSRRKGEARLFTPTNRFGPVRRSKGTMRIPTHHRGSSRRSPTWGNQKNGGLVHTIINRMIRQQATRYRQPSTVRNKRGRGVNRNFMRRRNYRGNDKNPIRRNRNVIPNILMNPTYPHRKTRRVLRFKFRLNAKV